MLYLHCRKKICRTGSCDYVPCGIQAAVHHILAVYVLHAVGNLPGKLKHHLLVGCFVGHVQPTPLDGIRHRSQACPLPHQPGLHRLGACRGLRESEQCHCSPT